jgi:pimeloyl-ACP methyl ester carboxylesterase
MALGPAGTPGDGCAPVAVSWPRGVYAGAERSHLASAQVDLETQVRDVVAVLEYEDLREVVLVGHSYGGMVIRGVADRVPERLTLLVYLDVEVPMDGQSESDLLPAQERAGYEEAAKSKGQGG